MAPSTSSRTSRAFTTSIRTAAGRLLVHVEESALAKLGAVAEDDTSWLRTLARHMPRFHALALQRAAREARHEITIRGDDVWWDADEGVTSRKRSGIGVGTGL